MAFTILEFMNEIVYGQGYQTMNLKPFKDCSLSDPPSGLPIIAGVEGVSGYELASLTHDDAVIEADAYFLSIGYKRVCDWVNTGGGDFVAYAI